MWLVTTDAHNTPQPRPVWFHWDGRTILVFSERATAKVRHIARNPRVAVHFNTDESGGSVAVLIGEARILRRRPPAVRVQRYLRKYRQGLKALGMTAAQFSTSFVVPILIRPTAMRGF